MVRSLSAFYIIVLFISVFTNVYYPELDKIFFLCVKSLDKNVTHSRATLLPMFAASPYQGVRSSGHVSCRRKIIKAQVASIGKYEEMDHFETLPQKSNYNYTVYLYYCIILYYIILYYIILYYIILYSDFSILYLIYSH